MEHQANTAAHVSRKGISLWAKFTIGFVLTGLLAVLLFPPFTGHPVSNRMISLSNIKQITFAAIAYTEDHDDRFPVAYGWETRLAAYIKNEELYTDPLGQPEFKNKRGYAMNGSASAIKITSLNSPAISPIFFTATMDEISALGGKGSLRFDEKERAVIAFADGSARQIPEERVATLIWDFSER